LEVLAVLLTFLWIILLEHSPCCYQQLAEMAAAVVVVALVVQV
jgi:hypothetical protein